MQQVVEMMGYHNLTLGMREPGPVHALRSAPGLYIKVSQVST